MKRKWMIMSLMMSSMVLITACGQTTDETNATTVAESESISENPELEVTLPSENVAEVELAEPTAMPEPTATPEPTVTSEPIASNTPEVVDGLIDGTNALEIEVPEDYSIISSCGGVIIAKQDDMYGAINYHGEVLVPCEYNSYGLIPNEQGYFVLVQEDEEQCTGYVFDSAGEEKLVIENMDRVKSYGDKLIYTTSQYDYETDEESGNVTFYDLSTSKVVFQEESTWYVDEPGGYIPSIAEGGEFWYTNLSGTINRIVVDEAGNGKAELVQGFEDEYEYIWSVFSDGFAMASGVLEADRSMLTNEDRTEVYYYDPYSIWNSEFYTEAFSERQYFDNGLYKYNKGKLFVIAHEDAVDGNTYYQLVNMEKATCDENNWVQNYEDIVVATYDFIQLSGSPYYLASKEGKYFYIDAEGQVVHDSFLDYTTFYNGYAVIIDVDGCAYMIDENFNKVAGGYEADAVSVMGGIFCVKNGEKEIYLAPLQE